MVDVLILPDRSDLNVYKGASTDGAEIGCCGPVSKKKSSCCAGDTVSQNDGKAEDVDFNELAGMYLSISGNYVHKS